MKSSILLFTIILTNFFSPLSRAEILLEQQLTETTNLVKAGNKSVTLLGTQLNVGDDAPNFKVVNESFSPVNLFDFSKKTILISVVPSLDTGVCSLQTKRFNDEVANLPNDIVMLTISNDLPFAQKRFCKAENIDKIKVLSDAVWRDFGSKYGLLIKDMGLLTRAIFVIDEQGKIAYKELVANISQHPDYEMALSTIRALSPTLVTPETETDTSAPAEEDSSTTEDTPQ
ncbi:thiol peroxidase [Colwelliaceae bacterium 6471]